MSGHRVDTDPSISFYSATKFAVTALSEGLRKELRDIKSNIKITVRENHLYEFVVLNVVNCRLFLLHWLPLSFIHVS